MICTLKDVQHRLTYVSSCLAYIRIPNVYSGSKQLNGRKMVYPSKHSHPHRGWMQV